MIPDTNFAFTVKGAILTIMKYHALFFVFAFVFFGMQDARAAPSATLSKNEIEHGEFFDIYGADFGIGTSEYSFVCFGSTENCVRGADIAGRSEFEWSAIKIRLQLPPSGIPTSGEIIVVGEGSRTMCSAEVCATEKVSVDKGRAQYWIKPSINSIIPQTAAKPGDAIKIIGNGFGDSAGEVLFGGSSGTVTAWTYRSIYVRAPAGISKTQNLTVRSLNGKENTTRYVISAPLSNDEFSYQQYYLEHIGAPELWQYAPKKDVVVAVLDDGVYQNHPDLQKQIWKNTDEIPGNNVDDDKNGYVDDYLGYNFWDNSSAVDPKGKHGTAVAGIIAAERDNGIGIAGIANRAKIMSVIISDGQAVSFSAIRKGVAYAIANGADVINISAASIGTSGFIDELTDVFQEAFSKGAIVVIAAGNRDAPGGIGQNLNLIPESPVCNNNGRRIFLGVAALDNNDSVSDGRAKAPWASYGKKCVNISAPGSGIVGAVPPAFQKDSKFYESLSGSSFSAPMVSGIAAAMKSIQPEWSNWEIINRIIASAEDIDRFNTGFEGQLGGRVQADDAMSSLITSPRTVIVHFDSVQSGGRVTMTVDRWFERYGLRITDGKSIDAAIPNNSISMIAADTLEVVVPEYLSSGTYQFRITGADGGSLISEQKITVNATSQKEVTVSPLSPQMQSNDSDTQKIQQTSIPQHIQQQSAQQADRQQNFSAAPNKKLTVRLSGSILLQVESHGEAWYVSPSTGMRMFLGRPSDAFDVMRKQGLGVGHSIISRGVFSKRLLGRILIDVEKNGEAYYIYPKDKRAYFLGRPSNAFDVMRRLGTGITNRDLLSLRVSPVSNH